jgi:uncharacterized membrane protein YbhN (UPF0104 family)
MTVPFFSALDDRKRHGIVASLIITSLGYLAFSFWSGWHDVLAAFHSVGLAGLAVALALSLLNYALRFVRWQMYFSALGYAVPHQPAAIIYLAGFSLTTTPGKAGELLRGVFLQYYGVSLTHAAVAFLSERLSDLLAVVLLALLGATLYPHGWSVTAVGLTCILLAQFVLSRPGLLEAAIRQLQSHAGRGARLTCQALLLLLEARRCHTPRLLFTSTVLSVVAWAAEACAFYLILHWMGVSTGLAFAVSVYALSMLAGAISFMPGGLGSAEAVMISLLLWAGVDDSHAIAATVMIRLTTLWFAVALGGLALLCGGKALRRPAEPLPIDVADRS